MIKLLFRLPLLAALAASSQLVTASEPLTAPSERLVDGEKSYRAICASCHDSGTDGAPVTANREDWKERSHLWEAVLFEHAEKGYIKMPAMGGSDYATEYDVDAAAEYMLTITHPDMHRD